MRNLLRWATVALSAATLAAGLAGAATAANASAGSNTRVDTPLALSSLCSYTGSQPELSSGSSGTAVKQAQCELNWAYANGHGDTLAVDGSFGSLTKGVTEAFQRCVHISVDGIIGPDTWSELNHWVNQSGYACG